MINVIYKVFKIENSSLILELESLTFEITAILATASNILNQIPKSCARCAIGLLFSQSIIVESIRISKMLFARAKNGANGKAATKMVMKPNWITEKRTKGKYWRCFWLLISS